MPDPFQDAQQLKTDAEASAGHAESRFLGFLRDHWEALAIALAMLAVIAVAIAVV